MDAIILIGILITLVWYVMLFLFILKINNNMRCIREIVENNGFYRGQQVRHKETKEIWTIKSISFGKVICYNSRNSSKDFAISELEK